MDGFEAGFILAGNKKLKRPKPLNPFDGWIVKNT
jgi:hypothetical protein